MAWHLVFGPVPVGEIVVLPGFVAAVVLVAVSFPVVWNRGAGVWAAVWIGISAIALTDLVPMVMRSSGLDPTLPALVPGALASVVLVAVGAWSAHSGAAEAPGRLEVAAGAVIVGLMILGFQVFNRVAAASGVANEDRSLMLKGLEIHHINWGILILTFAGVFFWRFPGSGPWRLARVLVLGVGCGFITDEWLYYALKEVSDAAYFTPVTWGSALALAVCLPFFWLLLGGRRTEAPPGAENARRLTYRRHS